MQVHVYFCVSRGYVALDKMHSSWSTLLYLFSSSKVLQDGDSIVAPLY